MSAIVSSSMNCSTYLSVSIICSSRNISKPHIKIDSVVDNNILGNKKNTIFHSCHRKEISAHVCTMTSSVKEAPSKHRIQAVATTAAAASAVDASATEEALAGSKRSGLNLWQELFPQDGALPSESSLRSLKAPSCSESARASLTARDTTSSSTESEQRMSPQYKRRFNPSVWLSSFRSVHKTSKDIILLGEFKNLSHCQRQRQYQSSW